SISDNTASGSSPSRGGAINANGLVNNVNASTLSKNVTVRRGGGIFSNPSTFAGSSFSISNSTISGNSSSDEFGGARLASETVLVSKTTIAFNAAIPTQGLYL